MVRLLRDASHRSRKALTTARKSKRLFCTQKLFLVLFAAKQFLPTCDPCLRTKGLIALHVVHYLRSTVHVRSKHGSLATSWLSKGRKKSNILLLRPFATYLLKHKQALRAKQ